MIEIKETFFGFVSEVPEDYNLITDSQDIQALCDHIGIDYDTYEDCTFFVNIEEGDYADILYCIGLPYLGKEVFRLTIQLKE